MNRKGTIILVFNIIVIVVTSLFLLTGRESEYPLSSFMDNRNGINFIQNIGLELANRAGYYNDYLVDDYDSLCDCSNLVVDVKIKNLKQVQNAIFTECEVINIVKGVCEKEIVIVQINYFEFNDINSKGERYYNSLKPLTIALCSPSNIMQIDKKYRVFLNEVSEYGDEYYRQSTILYSIIPLNAELSYICLSDNKSLSKNNLNDFDYIIIDNLLDDVMLSSYVKNLKIRKGTIVQKDDLIKMNDYYSLYKEISDVVILNITNE